MDSKIQTLESLLEPIIWSSILYFFVNTVRFIAMEKEKQLKEAMKIMGLPNWLHWTGWFIKSMSYFVIVISLMVIVLKVITDQVSNEKQIVNENAFILFSQTTHFNQLEKAVLEHSDWSVLWVFLLAYGTATITFGFMLSVFFSKANTAATAAGIAWAVTYLVSGIASKQYDYLPTSIKLLICLLSNPAMGCGIKIILRFETAGEGNFFLLIKNKHQINNLI